MEMFIVEVVETYRRYVEVKAVDEDKAYDIIEEKVIEGEIDLPRDGGDYKYERELFIKKKSLDKARS